MMMSMNTEVNTPPKDESFSDTEARHTGTSLTGGIVLSHELQSPKLGYHHDNSIALRTLEGYIALEMNEDLSCCNNYHDDDMCIDNFEPVPIRHDANPQECQELNKKKRSFDNVIIDMSVLHNDFSQQGMPIMVMTESTDINDDDEEDPYAPRPILERDNSIYFMDLKRASQVMPNNCSGSTITSVDHYSLTQEEERLIELAATRLNPDQQWSTSRPSKRHCSSTRSVTTPGAAALVTPQDSCTSLHEDELSFDVTDLAKRLASRMRESCATMSALQKWDRENGLPKSHCQTMVNTSRSRTQLLEGVVVKKWNGKPLMEFEGAEKLVRPIQRRSSCRGAELTNVYTNGTTGSTTGFNKAKPLSRNDLAQYTDTASESEILDGSGDFPGVLKFTHRRMSV